MTTRTATPGALGPSRRRQSRRAGGAGALGRSEAALPASSAGTDESITTKRGSASFNDNTEIVTANDTLANKQGVQAFLSWKTKSGKGRSVTVEDAPTGPTTAGTGATSRSLRAPRCT